MTESGGYLIPGMVTVCEPIWNNWFGRLLQKWFKIYRQREHDFHEELMEGLRETMRLGGRDDT